MTNEVVTPEAMRALLVALGGEKSEATTMLGEETWLVPHGWLKVKSEVIIGEDYSDCDWFILACLRFMQKESVDWSLLTNCMNEPNVGVRVVAAAAEVAGMMGEKK